MKYTYFFYCSETGLTKIGRTQFPQQRFNQLGGKKNLTVIGLIEGDREAEMHASYSASRQVGEWFNLTKGQLAEIKQDYPSISLPLGERPKRTRLKTREEKVGIPANLYELIQKRGVEAHQAAQERERIKLMGGTIHEVELDLTKIKPETRRLMEASAQVAGVSLVDYVAQAITEFSQKVLNSKNEEVSV